MDRLMATMVMTMTMVTDRIQIVVADSVVALAVVVDDLPLEDDSHLESRSIMPGDALRTPHSHLTSRR